MNEKLKLIKIQLDEMICNEDKKKEGNEFLIECLEKANRYIRYSIRETK